MALLLLACIWQIVFSSPVLHFPRQVKYGDSKAVELVTNEFSSKDLQQIAERMVGSLLETSVLRDRPMVTISTVKNKTSEYIDTTNVMNSIQTSLVKSGKVRFTRSIQEMPQGIDELNRQNRSELYPPKNRAAVGQMEAAKFALEGELTSIVKQTAWTKDVFYKFTLKMFDVEAGTIEWQEEEEIRKTSGR
ncbi:penicillin-binding protein activator LpoB [Paucibacter sp. PLA-PC-4]|uniref:penicillin-binding protein activator LpoB n=1 Tax=Paucibacter sp. PLA-PC-4 TaxID=2993655 RepID=UPI00224AB71B|nr:penicillin-binding protein activator LpoB [Paucibacter sp. PLA-PC-4]MCX2865663.1 penicillin-binding protein activator LpoB [Paucibacter sp. PLA-PC-4]